MKRLYFSILLIVLGTCLLFGHVADSNTTTQKNTHPSTKRVAVLYFDDNSRFDSSTGCGCIPNFIGRIFGTKKKWDLEAGFATILNRKLAVTTVYQPISRDELLDAMAQMSLSRHDLKKLNKEQRAKLAELLNADVIVIGEIQKFNQSRMRANASRSLTESGREASSAPITASYMTGFAALAYRYRAHVQLNVKFYEASGSEITTAPISVTRYHSLAGTQVSGLQASVTEAGTDLRFGMTSEKKGTNVRPIVKPTELNKIKFATPKYDKTLFGHVTNEALIKVVLALRDSYGPNFITPWEEPSESDDQEKVVDEEVMKRPIKITYVDSEDPDMIYINAGSARGLAIDQKFDVYTDAQPIRDVDTGDILDYVKKKIATVAVVEIRNDRLSIVKIVEKTIDLKRGDVLKSTHTDVITQEKNKGDDNSENQ